MVRQAFFEDLTDTQIAERCGIPLATVKSDIRGTSNGYDANWKIRSCCVTPTMSESALPSWIVFRSSCRRSAAPTSNASIHLALCGAGEVRDLWRLLIEQVRAKQARAHVPLRCDAPDMRRWFEMTITPEPDNVVHFRSVLVFEEPRPAVAFLSEQVARDSDAPVVPVCSWCGEGLDGSQWRQIEEVVRDLGLLEELMPSINYGICPACRALMSADLLVPAQSSTPRAEGSFPEKYPGCDRQGRGRVRELLVRRRLPPL